MKIIAITNAVHDIIELEWLTHAESVHRQLRPQIPADYVARMREVFNGGADMAVCVRDEKICGITVYRIIEKTFSGRELYCDDLITDQALRSTGIGHALMAYMEQVADARGCDCLALDSGTQREQAHKFYFREGLTVPAFHFSKSIKK